MKDHIFFSVFFFFKTGKKIISEVHEKIHANNSASEKIGESIAGKNLSSSGIGINLDPITVIFKASETKCPNKVKEKQKFSKTF